MGKSHIAQALGHRACRLGKNVLHMTAQDLFKQLRAARADGSHDRRMLRFTTPELLIIDDLGLRPLRDDEPVDLYEIIRTRYERSATLITSNRSAPEMGELFGDPLLASAAMDRLLHDAHVLILEGASFRTPVNAANLRRTTNQRLQHDEPTTQAGGSLGRSAPLGPSHDNWPWASTPTAGSVSPIRGGSERAIVDTQIRRARGCASGSRKIPDTQDHTDSVR